MTKLPPIEKVYEAWTAAVDHRVEIHPDSTLDNGSATVTSSDGKKSYSITWRDGGSVFTSSDPATYWQGYVGYPVLAVLMCQHRLPLPSCAKEFSGINWTELNARHRRDYGAALTEVEEQRNIDPESCANAASDTLADLAALNLTLRRK